MTGQFQFTKIKSSVLKPTFYYVMVGDNPEGFTTRVYSPELQPLISNQFVPFYFQEFWTIENIALREKYRGHTFYMNKNFLKIIINDGVVTVATQTFNLFLIWYFAVKLHRQDMVALLGALQVIEIVGGPIGGAVADMINPAKILKWVSLMRIGVTSILFFSLFQTHINLTIWLLLSFSTFNSLLSVFYASAVEVSTYKFAKNESERVKNNAGFFCGLWNF
ncbi:hypothetical protein [Oenococcus sicerae]|uniref:hypothetical protein n=2 Tax=Oenococcus sicerae TaxID=2203724 RepID=UPI00265A96C0|nr:hypothetical protein [Oenococcus sicerae]